MCIPAKRQSKIDHLISLLAQIKSVAEQTRDTAEKNAEHNASVDKMFEQVIAGRSTVSVRDIAMPLGDFLPGTAPDGDYAIRYVNVYKNGNVGGTVFRRRLEAERAARMGNHTQGEYSHTEMVVINRRPN